MCVLVFSFNFFFSASLLSHLFSLNEYQGTFFFFQIIMDFEIFGNGVLWCERGQVALVIINYSISGIYLMCNVFI